MVVETSGERGAGVEASRWRNGGGRGDNSGPRGLYAGRAGRARWRSAGGHVSRSDRLGAAARFCPLGGRHVRWRRERVFRVSGEEDPGFGYGGLFIEVEGARKLRMRCGLRPRDRDRTL